MKNSAIITAVAVVVVGALAFFGGMKFQESKIPARGQFGQGFNRAGGGGGPGFARGGANSMAPVVGQIISQDDKSITVKLQDGSSKIVLISDSATISKTDTGAKTDLKTGENVAVFGTSNSDGSVTAQNVQLNPMFRTRGAQSSPSGSPR